MIRKILVPVRGDGKGDNVLAHAAALAHRHNAHIEVVHCRPGPEDLMPYGIAIPKYLRKQIVQQSYKVADQVEEGLRDELRVLGESLGLVVSDHNGHQHPTVSFTEATGRQADVIRLQGRLADLIAVAKPDRDRNLGKNTLKAALFNSGRPVMMCPPADHAPKILGEKVALAWNGSAEASRALAQCKSILRAAEKVWILSSGTDAGPGTSAENLVGYLRLHGIAAEIVSFAGGKRAGREILKAGGEIGADLLIMGAYGDSHERETIFGGNTQQVVDTAKMPVVFNH